jgi:hypothetical protein
MYDLSGSGSAYKSCSKELRFLLHGEQDASSAESKEPIVKFDKLLVFPFVHNVHSLFVDSLKTIFCTLNVRLHTCFTWAGQPKRYTYRS